VEDVLFSTVPHIAVSTESTPQHGVPEVFFEVNPETDVAPKDVVNSVGGSLHFFEVKGWIVCSTPEGASVKVGAVMNLLQGRQLRPKLIAELEKKKPNVVLLMKKILFRSMFLLLVLYCFFCDSKCISVPELYKGQSTFWVSPRSSITFLLAAIEDKVNAVPVKDLEVDADVPEMVVETSSSLYGLTIHDVEVRVAGDELTTAGAVLVGVSSAHGESGQVCITLCD
jgi:hypothetical protein